MDRQRAAFALTVVVALAGCGSSSHAPPLVTGDYVAKLPDPGAAAAVVVGKANAAGYVCDPRRHFAELLSGSRSGKRMTLRGSHGGTLTATVTSKMVVATFKSKGMRAIRIAGAPVKQPAGFYRAARRVHGKPASAGWIVFADGSQRGALTIGTTVGPAPTLSTSTSSATLSGTRLSATRISSGSISQTGQIGQIGGG